MKKFLFTAYSFLIFFTPLLFVRSTNELFEFPKTFLLYFVSGLIFMSVSVAFILKPRKIKFPAPAVLLFVLINIVCTLFSSHAYTSVWGYYGRFNDSLISTLVFFGLYVIAINIFSKEDFKNFLKFAILASILVSIFGVIQKADRVYSTFGQPNWLAQYLAIILPFIIYLVITSKNFGIWVFVYALEFTCLWFTYSLAGFLGFIASVFVLILVLFSLNLLNWKTLGRLVILGAVSLVVVIFNFAFLKNRIHDVIFDASKLLGSIQRVYALEDSNIVSDPGYIRFGLWRGTFDLIMSSKKNFLVGCGPETFPYAFQPFRPAILNYSSEWDFVLNKPHNYFLEVFSELGFVGLVSYLLLLVYGIKKSPKIILPSVVAFLVTNFFGWPVVATSLMFWIWLAYVEKQSS
jgi:O-antigen ligase